MSNNRWDGQPSGHYRPTFQTVSLQMWGDNGVTNGGGREAAWTAAATRPVNAVDLLTAGAR